MIDWRKLAANASGKVRQRGLLRLLLFFTGHTHAALQDFAREAGTIIGRHWPETGEPDGMTQHLVINELITRWGETYQQWSQDFEVMRQESAAIAFGELMLLHELYVRPKAAAIAGEKTEIQRLEIRDWRLEEATQHDFVFDPQLRQLLEAAKQRLGPDGMRLSQRLWRFDRETQAKIRQAIYEGISQREGAWKLAKRLEGYLGFGVDCPRWTSTRLRLTKKEIATGDRRGLKSGDECRGQGVAYNALRLARNEITIAQAMATDALMAQMPFVEQEQINLNPAHPVEDECDQIVTGGQDGRGIYPKGTIGLPIHVQCSPAGQDVQTTWAKLPIEQVQVGAWVFTHMGRYRPVVATMRQHCSGDLIKVKLASGREVMLTPEHPLMVNGQWKPVAEIQVGDRVRVSPGTEPADGLRPRSVLMSPIGK